MRPCALPLLLCKLLQVEEGTPLTVQGMTVDSREVAPGFRALFSSLGQSYPGRRIIAVFGAPGGKALERRSTLPAIAGAHAHHLIFIEEDPAHESVGAICAELAAHTPPGVSYEVICDREQAVRHAACCSTRAR